jgi:ankyrin repeat protein
MHDIVNENKVCKDNNGCTALHHCLPRSSFLGNDECIITLLDYRSNINEKNNNGESPIDVSNELTKGIINKWIVHCIRMKFLLKSLMNNNNIYFKIDIIYNLRS